jgi:hypothetical protein
MLKTPSVNNDEFCNSLRSEQNCGLHPLIHSLLELTLVQYVVSHLSEEKTPTDKSSPQGQWGLVYIGGGTSLCPHERLHR